MMRWVNYMRKRLLNICNRVLRVILVLLLSILITIFIKTIAIDYSYVSGHSMSPTLHDGQPLLVMKCSYGARKPRNIYEIQILGSVVYYLSEKSVVDSVLRNNPPFEYMFLFSFPKRGDIVVLNVPVNNNLHAVKRCVAIAGDSIPYNKNTLPYNIVPYKGMVIDAKSLNEMQSKYMQQNKSFMFEEKDSTYIALDDFVYVLGDNLEHSEDSRNWGAIPMSLIFGQVFTNL